MYNMIHNIHVLFCIIFETASKSVTRWPHIVTACRSFQAYLWAVAHMRYFAHSVYNVVRVRQHQTGGAGSPEASAPLRQGTMTWRGAAPTETALLLGKPRHSHLRPLRRDDAWPQLNMSSDLLTRCNYLLTSLTCSRDRRVSWYGILSFINSLTIMTFSSGEKYKFKYVKNVIIVWYFGYNHCQTIIYSKVSISIRRISTCL